MWTYDWLKAPFTRIGLYINLSGEQNDTGSFMTWDLISFQTKIYFKETRFEAMNRDEIRLYSMAF